MCNPNPVAQHDFKMFCILLFSCELKLRLKWTEKQCAPDLQFNLSIIFYGEEGNDSLQFIILNTRGVILLYALEVPNIVQALEVFLDIREVIYCHVLETQPLVSTRGTIISRAYVTICSGIELQIP